MEWLDQVFVFSDCSEEPIFLIVHIGSILSPELSSYSTKYYNALPRYSPIDQRTSNRLNLVSKKKIYDHCRRCVRARTLEPFDPSNFSIFTLLEVAAHRNVPFFSLLFFLNATRRQKRYAREKSLSETLEVVNAEFLRRRRTSTNDSRVVWNAFLHFLRRASLRYPRTTAASHRISSGRSWRFSRQYTPFFRLSFFFGDNAELPMSTTSRQGPFHGYFRTRYFAGRCLLAEFRKNCFGDKGIFTRGYAALARTR